MAHQLAPKDFKQVECEVNGAQVADLTSLTQHYKVYLEHELTYCNNWIMMHVAPLGHQPKRRPNCLQSKILAKDNIVSFSTPIFVDFFGSAKYLIPGAMIKLRFSRNENGLCFTAPADNYKIAVKSVSSQDVIIYYQLPLNNQIYLRLKYCKLAVTSLNSCIEN